jgi:hypothetical protein
VKLDKKDEAREEVGTLHKNLSNRGVNKPVLEDIQAFGDSL